MYRWGFEGKYDVKVFKPSNAMSQDAGVVVPGSVVTLCAQVGVGGCVCVFEGCILSACVRVCAQSGAVSVAIPPLSALLSSAPILSSITATTATATWPAVVAPADASDATYEVCVVKEGGETTPTGVTAGPIAYIKNLQVRVGCCVLV